MCTTWGILIFDVELTDFKLRKHWCIFYAIYLFKQFVNNYWSFERIDHASTDAWYLIGQFYGSGGMQKFKNKFDSFRI